MLADVLAVMKSLSETADLQPAETAPKRDTWDSLDNVRGEIRVATQIVDCLTLAASSLDDHVHRDAMVCVAAIATDHLVKATGMIDALMGGGDEG